MIIIMIMMITPLRTPLFPPDLEHLLQRMDSMGRVLHMNVLWRGSLEQQNIHHISRLPLGKRAIDLRLSTDDNAGEAK
jgi:hypothetical protein